MSRGESHDPGGPARPSGSEPYWRRIAEDVAHELPGLLGANAVFLGWCLPGAALLLVGLPGVAVIVAPLTLGPGLVGLLTYAGRLARGEGARCWRDSLAGARLGFGAGVAVVVVAGVALTVPVLAQRLAVAHGLSTATVAILVAQALVGAFVAMTCVHAASLVGLYGQRGSMALRNAVLLSLRHPVSTAGLAGLGLVSLHLAHLLRGGPLVVLPAILAVCAAHHTLRLVEDACPTNPGTRQETPWRPS
jgi:hypothetical protein